MSLPWDLALAGGIGRTAVTMTVSRAVIWASSDLVTHVSLVSGLAVAISCALVARPMAAAVVLVGTVVETDGRLALASREPGATLAESSDHVTSPVSRTRPANLNNLRVVCPVTARTDIGREADTFASGVVALSVS